MLTSIYLSVLFVAKLSLSASDTCTSQIDFCSNLCTNHTSTPAINTCDKHLSWACTCKDGFAPSKINYTFPAEYQRCNDEITSCRAKCKSNTVCAQSCSAGRNCTAKDINDGKTALPTSASASASPSDDSDLYSATYLVNPYIFNSIVLPAIVGAISCID